MSHQDSSIQDCNLAHLQIQLQNSSGRLTFVSFYNTQRISFQEGFQMLTAPSFRDQVHIESPNAVHINTCLHASDN